MTYDIPGTGILELTTVILDLNGTLAVNGVLVSGVADRLEKLKKLGYTLVLLTGNTRGDADVIAKELDIDWYQAKTSADKRAAAIQLGAETSVSIGNGRIDLELTEIVGLGIVVL